MNKHTIKYLFTVPAVLAAASCQIRMEEPARVGGETPAPSAAPARTAPVPEHRDYGTWRSSVFGGGGYLQNVVFAPSDPSIMYIYVDVGGIYRSADSGRTWKMIHGSLPPSDGHYSIRGMLVAGDNPDEILIAAGNQWTPRRGVFLSTDAGGSWTRVLEVQVFGNEGHRSMGTIMERGPDGSVFLASAGDGLWRSRDNGRTWDLQGLEGLNITDLKLAPDGRGWISAQAWTAFGNRALSGGFFITADGGNSWEQVSDTAPDELAVAADGSIVGIFNATIIRRSLDNGRTWEDFGEGLPINPGAANDWTSDSRFRAITAGPGFLLVGSSRGTISRRDAGDPAWRAVERKEVVEVVEGRPWWGRIKPNEWQHFGACLGSIIIAPDDPGHWWFTDWYSAYETTDAGATWVQRIDGIEVTVIHYIKGDPRDPGLIHAGMADNGYIRSVDGGISFDAGKKQFSNMKMISISPALPGRLYGTGDQQGTWRADRIWVSVDAGRNWWLSPMKGLPSGKDHSMNSIAAHPENPYEVFVGVSGKVGEGGGVYRSRDGGRSFEPFLDGLEENQPFFHHEIWSVGPELAVSDDLRIVAVSHDRNAAYCHDGSRWQPVDAGTRGKPRCLVASGNRFYLARDEGGLMTSSDGITWTQLLEENVRTLAAGGGVIAIATPENIRISLDGGSEWTSRPLPPHGVVKTMALSGGRLFAGTAGGGIFWMPLDPSGDEAVEAGPAGSGILDVLENRSVQTPEIPDGSFTDPATVTNRWNLWTGSGNSERHWTSGSSDERGGSLRLSSIDGAANTSSGLNFPAVPGSFRLQFDWTFTGSPDTEIQIALRSYRGGEQTDWNQLVRSTGPGGGWTRFSRDVALKEGADRGELVMVLKGEGSAGLDAIEVAVPPQIFGTPVDANKGE